MNTSGGITMYVAKSILAVALTVGIWIIYARTSIMLEEKYKRFSEWGPLSFPLFVCGLLGLNMWIGTPLSAGLFVVAICTAMFWALGVSLRR